MRPKQFGAITLLGFIGASSFHGLAQASSLFKDAENNIYVGNLSNQEEVTFAYPGTPRISSARANGCGAVIVRGTSTNPIAGTIRVDNTSINTTTLPTQLLPPCGTNGTFAETRPANFKTPDGQVVIVGKTPNNFYGVETPENAVRRVRGNACGFVRVAPNARFTHAASQQISINGGSPRTVSSIETKEAPLCRSGALYLPQSWWGGSIWGS